MLEPADRKKLVDMETSTSQNELSPIVLGQKDSTAQGFGEDQYGTDSNFVATNVQCLSSYATVFDC